ncbi:hypothetical protein DNH61_17615 [Paenibacillus sambharensis]|uniref:Uncharacterized protein n=2 Tax=Paenibacillus sambharensis TaxID=1803190 RepID=A0A2W1L6F0_9BACL|nr:hypothetical protein DNH61_17615 [Paenibacillus sambharensis]
MGRRFVTWRSFTLWILPLCLMVAYTYFHYKTLNIKEISFFKPFQGAYLIYTGWFVVGFAINVARYRKGRANGGRRD